ncbi:hypothetical protein MRX96_003186 [Rhipicephalus microplus]
MHTKAPKNALTTKAIIQKMTVKTVTLDLSEIQIKTQAMEPKKIVVTIFVATALLKIYAICVCVDAPARAAVGNQVQFNGFCGCPWCLACEESQEVRILHRYVDLIFDPAVFFIVIGYLVFIIAGLQCAKALRENKNFMRLYGFSLEQRRLPNVMYGYGVTDTTKKTLHSVKPVIYTQGYLHALIGLARESSVLVSALSAVTVGSLAVAIADT